MERFFRSLRLKSFFNTPRPLEFTYCNTGLGHSQLSLKKLGLRNKSTFVPPPGDNAVETYIKMVKKDIDLVKKNNIDTIPANVRYNMSRNEQQELRTLMNEPDIIFKPADKGGALVVMDRDQYIQEILNQLSNEEVYKKVSKDPLPEIQKRIAQIIDQGVEDGIIEKDTKKFLIKEHPMTPVLYTLPKIHKDPAHPPGRPIVAGTDSVFSPLATYLDRVLQPLVVNTRSYLKDNMQLLNQLQNITLPNTGVLLVSLDVGSLYTSISHEMGIQAASDSLLNTDHSGSEQSFLIDLLKIVLYENYFLFGDTYYMQRRAQPWGVMWRQLMPICTWQALRNSMYIQTFCFLHTVFSIVAT
ncbi:uncharacterized protein LOC121395440 isoform X1 [Xenopus laevis]|uniref:Uncharacterized protein LOC121395440 isoform X1 n=1 Tax=Xenopus laevis TaxID=8355 RepID=A0A8J1L5W6_XENLA|nr:uncharacterized protein LOC121395440 isoform X1 [Xenopus laevis]